MPCSSDHPAARAMGGGDARTLEEVRQSVGKTKENLVLFLFTNEQTTKIYKMKHDRGINKIMSSKNCLPQETEETFRNMLDVSIP